MVADGTSCGLFFTVRSVTFILLISYHTRQVTNPEEEDGEEWNFSCCCCWCCCRKRTKKRDREREKKYLRFIRPFLFLLVGEHKTSLDADQLTAISLSLSSNRQKEFLVTSIEKRDERNERRMRKKSTRKKVHWPKLLSVRFARHQPTSSSTTHVRRTKRRRRRSSSSREGLVFFVVSCCLRLGVRCTRRHSSGFTAPFLFFFLFASRTETFLVFLFFFFLFSPLPISFVLIVRRRRRFRFLRGVSAAHNVLGCCDVTSFWVSQNYRFFTARFFLIDP